MRIANARADRCTSYQLRGVMWMNWMIEHGHSVVHPLDSPDVIITSKVTDRRFLESLEPLFQTSYVIYDIDDYIDELDDATMRSENLLLLRRAKLVTCSTERIKQKYMGANSRCIVVKNSLPGSWYDYSCTSASALTIYCGGNMFNGVSYRALAAKCSERAAAKHNATIILGNMDGGHHHYIKSLDEYIVYLRTLRPTVALAPMLTSEQAKYKSNVKFLVYTACGIPTLMSDVLCYQNTGGRLVKDDEWYEVIDEVIGNHSYRNELLSSARAMCKDNFTLDHSMNALLEAI